MGDTNYLKLIAEVKREGDTEKRVRAMDAYDIVKEIHDLEDQIEALENPD